MALKAKNKIYKGAFAGRSSLNGKCGKGISFLKKKKMNKQFFEIWLIYPSNQGKVNPETKFSNISVTEKSKLVV